MVLGGLQNERLFSAVAQRTVERLSDSVTVISLKVFLIIQGVKRHNHFEAWKAAKISEL